jgi:hypothetical protein
VFDILKALFQSKPAPHREIELPVMRNMILDILDESRRKIVFHLHFDVNATRIQAELDRLNAANPVDEKLTLTTYYTKVFADAVATVPEMQGYRRGTRKLIVFEDVDISIMVERKVDGARMPLPYIIRAANKKPMHEIHRLIRGARSSPLYGSTGPLTNIQARFFSLPRWIRKCVWFFIRRDPHLFRLVAGTVGITSLPIILPERAGGAPITPMSLTLLVGCTSPIAKFVDGASVEESITQLCLACDHAVIDAANATRFMIEFRNRLYGENTAKVVKGED